MPEMTAAEALSTAMGHDVEWDPAQTFRRLRALGFAIVPVEATPAMRYAGSMQMNAHKLMKSRHRAGSPDIWKAMLDAAMVAPDAEKGKT